MDEERRCLCCLRCLDCLRCLHFYGRLLLMVTPKMPALLLNGLCAVSPQLRTHDKLPDFFGWRMPISVMS
jgi:hypothetical protein